MKLHEQQEFLQDLLEGEAVEALRRDSLQQGLAALRCKRRRQLMARSAVLAGIPLLVCVLVVMSRFHPGNTMEPFRPAPVISSVPASDQAVKVINDQELFALFPNRPLALVGKPGHQQLLFLDQAQN